jgi:predicted phage baseplate assembly protein
VGAGAIAHIALDTKSIDLVRNPLPATGGVDPESVETVRLNAPVAFRKLERAVTEADYSELALRHPQIERAVAYREWTGSWMTIVLLVDRVGGLPIDASFEADVIEFFDRYRMAGYDLEVRAPVSVPLDIAFTVCLNPDAIRAHVKEALTTTFGTGSKGFFNQDDWTFGQPVYVSEVIARAMSVPGVAWVDLDDSAPKPNRFQKLGRPPEDSYAAGRIAIGPREIARLDNDANHPENGRIEFLVEGGR